MRTWLSAFGFNGMPDMAHVVSEPLPLPAPGRGANCAAARRESGAVVPNAAVRRKCNTVSSCISGQPLFAYMGGSGYSEGRSTPFIKVVYNSD